VVGGWSEAGRMRLALCPPRTASMQGGKWSLIHSKDKNKSRVGGTMVQSKTNVWTVHTYASITGVLLIPCLFLVLLLLPSRWESSPRQLRGRSAGGHNATPHPSPFPSAPHECWQPKAQPPKHTVLVSSRREGRDERNSTARRLADECGASA
jgi:hypothetical protein